MTFVFLITGDTESDI